MKSKSHPLQKITHIVFDLDDTLVPSTPIYDIAVKAMGINPNGKSWTHAKMSLKAQLPPEHVMARSRFSYLKNYLEQQDQFSPQKLFKLHDTYEKKLAQCFQREWKRLKRDRLFKKLSKKYHLSIITNENARTQLVKLQAMDPKANYFSVIVTSEEAGAEKPSAQIFNLLHAKIGKPKPERILLVGDNIKNDIIPARRRGWGAVWMSEYPEKRDGKLPKGAFSIERLEELAPLLGITY